MYENTSLIPHDLELHDMKFLPSHPYVIQSNHSMVLESRTLCASAHPAQICKPQHWGNMCYVTMIHPRGVMLSAAHETTPEPPRSAHLLSQRHVFCLSSGAEPYYTRLIFSQRNERHKVLEDFRS